jgi:hypothetical protein
MGQPVNDYIRAFLKKRFWRVGRGHPDHPHSGLFTCLHPGRSVFDKTGCLKIGALRFAAPLHEPIDYNESFRKSSRIQSSIDGLPARSL